ncbi:MAG: helix-turn-helix domain-containing protein [Roseburia sp.]|nr:helix-turn-helix domain-containing protein [Roseburia sp.]
MDIIGSKIRTLRKNKNMTQEELAEVLSVSPQAISKWENGQSTPDIELLPVIARYFGITMDEFFNYRLDALNYKERFIRFMVDNGVLKFGDFKLNSGRVSPYYVDTSNYKTAAQIAKLGEFYAECIRENNVQAEMLYGNTGRETPLVISTSMILFKKYGIDVNYCINNEIGNVLKEGQEVLIIEDTLTSGDTLRTTIEKIKKETGARVNGIVVSVDRQEKGKHISGTARYDIEKEFGVKVFSIVTFEDIINTMKNGVISAEHLEKMTCYKAEYGGNHV